MENIPENLNSENKSEVVLAMEKMIEEVERLKTEANLSEKQIKEKLEKIKNEDIPTADLLDIEEHACEGIDYVHYIRDIDLFLQRQKILHKKQKPALSVKREYMDPDTEDELLNSDGTYALMPPAGRYHDNEVHLSVSDSDFLHNRNISPRGVLYNMAVLGVNVEHMVTQHEVIHHYQRGRKQNFLSKIFGLSASHKKEMLHEIHARLHQSMLGSDFGAGDVKNIIKVLSSSKRYRLQKQEEELVRDAFDKIKKLYALNVSDRRIARLVMESKYQSPIFFDILKAY